MKNYKDLLKKLSKWMKEDSLLFVHHFCHKAFAYHFEVLLLTSGTYFCRLHSTFNNWSLVIYYEIGWLYIYICMY